MNKPTCCSKCKYCIEQDISESDFGSNIVKVCSYTKIRVAYGNAYNNCPLEMLDKTRKEEREKVCDEIDEMIKELEIE